MDYIISNAQQLGSVVRKLRKAQSLTQEDLAGISGISRKFVIDLENGKNTIQLGKVLLVLSSLGVAISLSNNWQ